MQTVGFGEPQWNRDELLSRLEQFASLYEQRPIPDNSGGMSSTHMFLFWFILNRLQPRVVIESGVWQGQGTWFIEKACPNAQIYCIDIDWSHLKYRSPVARYLDKDISRHDWRALPKDETVVFFDDHIDAIKRCGMAAQHGFKHLIFEDNYPPHRGDCYSLQEVFLHTGHTACPGIRAQLSRLCDRLQDRHVPPNKDDAAYIRDIADVYAVMPPIFKLPRTRWGDEWDDRFPTPAPLLQTVDETYQQRYFHEAKWYTWLCYLHLR